MPDRLLFAERDVSNDADVARLMMAVALDLADAEDRLQREVEAFDQAGRRFHLAFALALLARVLALRRSSSASEVAASKARLLFKEEGSLSGEALVLHALAISHVVLGRHAAALEDLTRAVMLARGSQWPDLQACAQNVLGIVLNDMGRSQQAVEVLKEALGLPEPVLSPSLRLRLANNHALALARTSQRARDAGDETWRTYAADAVAHAQAIQPQVQALPPPERAGFMETLAAALVALGELDDAHRALDIADYGFSSVGDNLGMFYASLTRGRAHLDGNQPEKALVALQRGKAAAAHVGSMVLIDELELHMSRAHEQLGDCQSALASYKEFHRHRELQVFTLAEERARSLAITLDVDRIHRESRQDALTGLLNRRAFEELFAALLKRADLITGVGLALIDLDHFKLINDRLGHAAGDEALQLVAKLLVSECRQTDFAARLGGDEFVLVVQGEPGTAEAVCRRVLSRLKEHEPPSSDAGSQLTISAGVAETNRPMTTAEMISLADEALYRVKRSGRGSVLTNST